MTNVFSRCLVNNLGRGPVPIIIKEHLAGRTKSAAGRVLHVVGLWSN